MERQKKVLLLANPSVQKAKRLRRRVITSVPVEVCMAKSRNMKVVEDVKSRLHMAVTLLVEGDKEIQEVRELRVPKALPGYSGRKLVGRSKAGGGTEEKDEERAVRRMEEVTNEVLTANPVDSTTCGVLADEPLQHANQSWDCSQVENEQERAAMNWLMDDEMMRHWEDVGKEEEELTAKRSEGRNFFKWKGCKVHQNWSWHIHEKKRKRREARRSRGR